jgi:7tm Chemosensory receptor.
MEAVEKIDTALKPLLCLCKIFGISPVSYTDDKQTGATKLMSLPSDVFWCVAVLICYLTNFALSMSVLCCTDKAKLYIVSLIYKICNYVCSLTVIFFVSTFKRRSLPQILVLISEVDQVLYKDAERQAVYKKTRSLIVKELIIICLILLPLQISYYITCPKNSFLGYYVLLIENVGYVSLFLMIIQFTNIVLILRQRYKHVNKWFDFRTDLWREGTKSRVKNILLLADMKSCVLSNHNTKYGRYQILQQRRIYSKLHDIVHLVNSYFGVSVLMFVFWLFLSVVSVSYMCVSSLVAAIKNGQQPAQYMWFIDGVFWSALCVVILFLITLSCQTTTEECSKAQIIVEKLMLRSGLGCETVNELRVMSQQLNNMKISFTAGGFFTLELSLVQSFVGVICTYLVIVAQFQ